MAEKDLTKFFLSASIPDAKDEKYYNTADVIAIRDAVRALATVVIPRSKLIWGGHPSITPLIRYVMAYFGYVIKDHVTLYQSDYFSDNFPEDNFSFEDVRITERNRTLDSSLRVMRKKMIDENDFKAGIFIGGMDGVLTEYEMFRETHPHALVFPIASTGAAARFIYDNLDVKANDRLMNDYAYMALFRDLLKEFL